MCVNIIEYSSIYFEELYKILHNVFGSNVTKENLESNYLGSKKKIFLAMFDYHVIGCAFLEIKVDHIRPYKYGFVSYVAVDNNYRDLGIGKMLIAKISKVCDENDCKSIELTSADFRKSAHIFYHSQGFSIKKTKIFIKELSIIHDR